MWERESWLEILGRYLIARRDKKKQIKEIIFPRYHQLDVTRKLQIAILTDEPGGKYLVQHSAGSGKTNSIAWTAHFLAELHDALHNKVFDTVLVVSDRNVIDAQLQEALLDFQRTSGVVATITNKDGSKSGKLAEALSGDKKIVVCTIQTFPFALEAVSKLANMCGRYNLTASSETLVAHFQLQRQVLSQPSYNIAPAQKILNIVELEDQSKKAVNLFWGLVPSWAKDSKNSAHLINARSETVREKPSFRSAFNHHRCLIPATGFYEWLKTDSGKQAFHVHRTDQQLFAFVGLWEQWQHETETLYSCTIITTTATELMKPIHDRMPVIIPTDQYHNWLDKDADADQVFALLNNQAYTQMTATPVSDWVNNPRHDDERCISPFK